MIPEDCYQNHLMCNGGQWNKNVSIRNANNHIELERLGPIRHPRVNIEYIEVKGIRGPRTLQIV